MNQITHFLTGFLIARTMKFKHTQFETFFIAFCAILPDIDFLINQFIPFEHGVFTHTFLGGTLFVFGISLFSFGFLQFFPKKATISFRKLFLLGMIGMLSHQFLDFWTYLPDNPLERAGEIDHHLFFWPLWNFPIHINTIFPQATYSLRVWIEVVYSSLLGIIVFFQWMKKKEFFLECTLPSFWNLSIINGNPIDFSKKQNVNTLSQEEDYLKLTKINDIELIFWFVLFVCTIQIMINL